MRISAWRQKLGRYGALEAADRRLILRSAAYLCIARLMLLALPFRRLAKNLSRAGSGVRLPADAIFLGRLGFALAVASGHVPWRSDCFVQAIAARLMLRAEGFESTIHLGAERVNATAIAGHAWLTSAGTVVVGGDELDRYTEFLALTA